MHCHRKSTAPGEDGIHNEMLVHLPSEAKTFLLNIYNTIWSTSILPTTWKQSIVTPVYKVGKDKELAASYRPISLTSCVCKLFEKMINVRLVYYLETNNLLSEFQFGFRKNRCTIDPVMMLTREIQKSFASKKSTLGVFFDMEKAYDRT